MKYLKYFIFSLVLWILIQPLGALNLNIKFTVAFISFYLLTIYTYKEVQHNNYFPVFLVLLTPPFIALIFLNVLNSSQTWISLPSNVAPLLAVIAASLQNSGQKIIRLFNPLFWSVIILCYFLWANSLWVNWNKFGVIHTSVNERVPTFLAKNNLSKSVFSVDSLNSQLSVLDFWNTACGVCFDKFPLLDSLQMKYGMKGIRFYAFNVPLNRDTPGKADSMINTFGYTFQKINLADPAFADSFGIRVYPTTLVIDQNRRIRYRGSINELDHFLQSFIK